MRMLVYIDETDVKVESCAALYGFWFHLQIGKPEKYLDRIIAGTPQHLDSETMDVLCFCSFKSVEI